MRHALERVRRGERLEAVALVAVAEVEVALLEQAVDRLHHVLLDEGGQVVVVDEEHVGRVPLGVGPLVGGHRVGDVGGALDLDGDAGLFLVKERASSS